MLNAVNLKQKHKIFSKPQSEVEHRTAHHSDVSVLNVFETSKASYEFDLVFHNPVVVSMIQGKKVMHLGDRDPFEFVPGETIAMPATEAMTIDFPEADYNHPTQCMALEICPDLISDVALWMNEHYTRVEGKEWSWSARNFHLNNSKDLSSATNSLINTMVNENSMRDLKASLITRELVALLLRTSAKNFLLQNAMALHMSHRLAYAIHYIRTNITADIHVEDLAEKACLSRAQFFRAFKNELGMTPVQFINAERIARAKRALKKPTFSLADTARYAGFKSQSYFNRVFKAFTGMTPQAYRMKAVGFVV
ncbi:MAG: hypothetical protein RLZZ599_857 [Bacteroidota bacterium]